MAFPLIQIHPKPSIVLGIQPDAAKGDSLLSWQHLPSNGRDEGSPLQMLVQEEGLRNGNVFETDANLSDTLRNSIHYLEGEGPYRFGSEEAPLLLSLTLYSDPTSGEAPLELTYVGLSDQTMPAVIERMRDPGEAYFHYRMLIMMYADVVMERTMGLNRKRITGIQHRMNRRSEWLKERKGYTSDQLFSAYDHAFLAGTYKAMCQATFGKAFPEDPWLQLEGLITALIRYGDPAKAKEVVIRPLHV